MNDFNKANKSPTYFIGEAREILSSSNSSTARLKARNILEEGIRLYPKCDPLYLALGHQYDDARMKQQALECYAKAYKFAPYDIKNVMTYGGYLVKRWQFEKAEEVYLKAFKDGTDVKLLTVLGHLYQKIGESNNLSDEYLELSACCFGKAVSIDPSDSIPARRLIEMQERYNIHHTDEGWQKVVNRAQQYATHVPDTEVADKPHSPAIS